MKKKLLAVAMAACMTFASAAVLPKPAFSDTYMTASATFEEGDFKFEISSDSETTVVKYIGSGGDVVIPKTAGGKTVTRIYSGTFYKNESVTSVTVPDTINRIDSSAFDSCYNVKKITLPDSLPQIEYNTFSSCYSLESINIPKSVTKIGDWAFLYCYALDSVALPTGLKSIGYSSFAFCTSLKSITLPSGLEEIGSSAFYSCPAMKSVTIPEGLRALGDQAFGYKWDSIKKEIVKDEDFRIYGGINTLAEEYAQGEGFEFIARVAGKNRFATAAEVSKSMRTKTNVVVLANGMDYADALAGVPIARSMIAPILLTRSDTLPGETLAEIKRLGAKNVLLLGGEGAISENVVKTLKDNGCNTQRIAGANRFETAVKIAQQLNSSPEEVFFVYGLDFADALSSGTVAAIKGAPIVYLRTDGTIDKATADYLASLKKQGCVSKAYVIGGEGVISNAMMAKAGSALGVTPKRISGANRYETCTAVNTFFADFFQRKTVCAAKGLDFPDALAGGVLAAWTDTPILLADNALRTSQKQYLKSKNANVFHVLGGTGAVPDKLVNEIAAASK